MPIIKQYYFNIRSHLRQKSQLTKAYLTGDVPAF